MLRRSHAHRLTSAVWPLRRAVALAVAAGLLLSPVLTPTARAEEDTEPPQITHIVPPNPVAGTLVMRARIVDASPVSIVTLYWRHVGDGAWTPVPMQGAKPLFQTTLAIKGDFEFWIEAFDELGNGPSQDGHEWEPVRVSVGKLEAMAGPRTDEGSKTSAAVRPRSEPAAEPVKIASPPVKPSAPARPPKPPPPPKPEPPPEPPAPPAPPMELARTLRVAAARPLAPGRAEVLVDGALWMGDDFLVASSRLRGGQGSVRAGYALYSFLELSAATRFTWAQLTRSTGETNRAASLGDWTLGAHLVSPALGPVRLALDLSVELPAAVAKVGSWAVSPQALLAATYEHRFFRLSGQLGYRWDNTENLYPGAWDTLSTFGMQLSRYDFLRAGLAAEVPLGPFIPFVEYSLDLPVNRRHFGSCTEAPDDCPGTPALLPAPNYAVPQRAGVGARLEVAGTWAIVLAGEMSLAGAGETVSVAAYRTRPPLEGLAPTAPWAVRLQLAHQFDAPLPANARKALHIPDPPAPAQPPAPAAVPAPANETSAAPERAPAPAPAKAEDELEISIPSIQPAPPSGAPASGQPAADAPAAAAAPTSPPADAAPQPASAPENQP